MRCSRCQGPTTAKQINTKRGPATVYECTSGCKNDKGYPLGTFAPRGNANPTPPGARPPPQPNTQDEILRCLLRIEAILANPGKTHIAAAELKPDEEIPF